MLLKIVYAVNASRTGPDLDRMGQLEEFEPEVARIWLGDGTAVQPTEQELADHKAKAAKAAKAGKGKQADAEAEADQVPTVVETAGSDHSLPAPAAGQQ